MASTYLIHYKCRRKLFKLIEAIAEGTCEVEIENHETESLSSEDLDYIKDGLKHVNKAYQVDILNFKRLAS